MRLSSSKRGLSLPELLVAMTLFGIVAMLVAGAYKDSQAFYSRVSEQSREVGSAHLVLDRLESLCYGLPRQALHVTTSPSGQKMLVIQPLKTVSASGTTVYSSKRWVVENTAQGVRLWDIDGESTALGATPLKAFPPPAQRSKANYIWGKGWKLDAQFPYSRFPLTLVATPPAPDDSRYQRVIEGHL